MDPKERLEDLAKMTRRRVKTVDGERRIIGRGIGHITCEPEGFYLLIDCHGMTKEGSEPKLVASDAQFEGCTFYLRAAIKKLAPPAEVRQLGEDEAVLLVREDPGVEWWTRVAMPVLGCHAIPQLSETEIQRRREMLEAINKKKEASA